MTSLLNTQELSEYLNISTRKVKYMKAQSILPFISIGRSVRFDLEEVMRVIKGDQQPKGVA
jgi:excisionase family DNA binding protein